MLEEVEAVAVDYFELNGFLVRKGWSGGAAACFPFLIVRNLKEAELQEDLVFQFQWFSSDIIKTPRAVVSIIGDSLLQFGDRSLQNEKRLSQSLKKLLTAKNAPHFAWNEPAYQNDIVGHKRLVMVPQIPQKNDLRNAFCEKLEQAGAEGVITLRSLLDNLVQKLDEMDENPNSPRLKQLRILKQMGLLSIPQLNLFS
jgi:hypothetical protein